MMSHLRSGTALLVVATLAVAIAADVTVFSVVDPILVRPLPFERPEELAVITAGFPRAHLAGMGLSGPEALELAELTHAFAQAGAVTFSAVTVRVGDSAVRASAAQASAAALTALRPAPAAGRLYTADDDRDGAARVAVLGYAFWVRAFGADPRIAGRTIDVDGESTTVLGVMPPRADLLNRQIEIWLPLRLGVLTAGGRTDHRFTIVARRHRGVTGAAAAADLAAAVSEWQATTGEFHAPNPTFHPLEMRPLADATSGAAARPLAILSAAVGLVLLLACANAANLMLARTEARRAELAVRVALGAGTRHLLALYLTESLLLAGVASAAGLALAAFAIPALKALGPALVSPDDIVINTRVLVFTVAAAIVTGAAVGLLPFARVHPARAFLWLQGAGRNAGGTARRAVLQQWLVGTQIAAALALSVAGVMTVRSLAALTRIDPGFHADGVLRAQISLPQASYPDDEQVWDFYDRLVERVATLPGVHAAAVMSGLPPTRPANNTTVMLDGAQTFDHNSVSQVDFVQHVTPGYFATMGIALRGGRTFTAADNAAAAPVAIVNETLARRFWPGRSPIGHRLRMAAAGSPWFTVVGLVTDVRQAGLQNPSGSEMYVPYRQGRLIFSTFLPRGMNLVVSAPSQAAALAPDVRRLVRALEPAAAVSGVSVMTDVVSGTIAEPRLLGVLLTAFSAIAVLLASIGVYGVTSATVTARTAELGVRIALGASRRALLMHVLSTNRHAIAAGLATGSLGALAGARYLGAVLFATDARILPIAAAAAGLALVSAAAALIPAWRVTRLDPLTALRAN